MVVPKVGERYVIITDLNALRDGSWKKKFFEEKLDGYVGEVVEECNSVTGKPVLRLLEGPFKGIKWVVHHDWLHKQSPCNCPTQTLMLRGCLYPKMHY